MLGANRVELENFCSFLTGALFRVYLNAIIIIAINVGKSCIVMGCSVDLVI